MWHSYISFEISLSLDSPKQLLCRYGITKTYFLSDFAFAIVKLKIIKLDDERILFNHDVASAMLVPQRNKTAAKLVSARLVSWTLLLYENFLLFQ